MEIKTKRLELRPTKDSDLEDLAKLYGDPEVMQYILPPLSRTIVAEMIDWFKKEWKRLGYGYFALFEKQSGEFIGQCGLQKIAGKPDADEIELAFVIAKIFWGQGYATEAAEAVLDFGFTRGGLCRIVALTLEGNRLSKRVLEKSGFQFQENKKVFERMVMYYSLGREQFMRSKRMNQLPFFISDVFNDPNKNNQ